MIKTQLKEKHFQTLEDAMMEAKDREKWRAIIQHPSRGANEGNEPYLRSYVVNKSHVHVMSRAFGHIMWSMSAF